MIVFPSINAGIQNSNFLIKKDLVLHVDGGNINCYTGIGTSCNNLVKLNETGNLNQINFLNKSFETQDQDSYISFNKDFTALNNQATFFIIFQIPIGIPQGNIYDIIGSFGNLLYGYNFNFFRSSTTEVVINWEIFNSFGFGNFVGYNFNASELPKKICACGTLDGNSLKLYINGVLYASTNTASTDINFHNLIRAGAMGDIANTTTYPGLIIYEYLIYKRGLSTIEILQNFNTIKLKYNL